MYTSHKNETVIILKSWAVVKQQKIKFRGILRNVKRSFNIYRYSALSFCRSRRYEEKRCCNLKFKSFVTAKKAPFSHIFLSSTLFKMYEVQSKAFLPLKRILFLKQNNLNYSFKTKCIFGKKKSNSIFVEQKWSWVLFSKPSCHTFLSLQMNNRAML